MKTLTKKQALKLITDVCHCANIKVGDKTIVNDGFLYDEKTGNGYTYLKTDKKSSNQRVAEKAIREIVKSGGEFEVYSSYFNFSTGHYQID